MFKNIFKFFTPKNADHAAVIRFRLSVVYAFLGWNCFMVIVYKLMNYNLPADPVERRAAIIKKLQNDKDVKLIRIDGFKVIENRVLGAANNETKEKELEEFDKETNEEMLTEI